MGKTKLNITSFFSIFLSKLEWFFDAFIGICQETIATNALIISFDPEIKIELGSKSIKIYQTLSKLLEKLKKT